MGYFKHGAYIETDPIYIKNCELTIDGNTMMCDIEFTLEGDKLLSKFAKDCIENHEVLITGTIDDHIRFEKGRSIRISDTIKEFMEKNK